MEVKEQPVNSDDLAQPVYSAYLKKAVSGHKDLGTLQIYLEVSEEQRRQAVLAIASVLDCRFSLLLKRCLIVAATVTTG